MPLSASKCSNIVAYNPLSDCRQCVRARMVPADICLFMQVTSKLLKFMLIYSQFVQNHNTMELSIINFYHKFMESAN